ncbi:MAG: sensor histidine kinase [Tardiphaga sp.]|nr:sensor histidine kinase [Tardiphaga sp.]
MWREASLNRRLLLAAIAFIAAAMVVAAIVIGFVLHRFVQGQIDQRLDTQIVFLSSLLRAGGDGRLALAGNADGPPFEQPRRGWYWQVTGPANVLRSQSLLGADLTSPEVTARLDRPPHDGPPGPHDDRPMPADGPGRDGEHLHYRIKQVATPAGIATIVASSPRAAVLGPLREAMTTLAISLAVLGLALVAAMLLQIRLGLQPLQQLQRAVADVRSGAATRAPEPQPRELQPLVHELNGLLAQNEVNLERARRHVANLAHGLKTPLATLALALSDRGHNLDALHSLLGLMERRIRHHLGRARSAALSGPVRTRTTVAPRARDLGDVLLKIHADKAIALAIDVPAALSVACEAQDLDEMLGNLMENGFKWARRHVAVRAAPEDSRRVVIVIEDDGAGLLPAQQAQVVRPGERLDEASPGFGFGLSITRELAELYGGSLDLGRAELGGLRVTLRLPA